MRVTREGNRTLLQDCREQGRSNLRNWDLILSAEVKIIRPVTGGHCDFVLTVLGVRKQQIAGTQGKTGQSTNGSRWSKLLPGGAWQWRKGDKQNDSEGAGRWWVGCSRSSFCPPGICEAEGDWIGRQWFLTVKAKALPRFQKTWIKLSSVILRVLQGGAAVGGGSLDSVTETFVL